MTSKRFRFSDISIRTKVMIVTCAASVVALVSVAGGLYLFELRNFRQTFERELRTRKTTAIRCGDQTVRQVAKCIRAAPGEAACLVDAIAGPLEVVGVIELGGLVE